MITRILTVLLLFTFFPLLSQTGKDSIRVLIPEVAYTGDIVSNVSGGIKTGTDYLGMVNLKLDIRLWKGGSLFFNGANTHGGQPSVNLTGDYQILSNIEAGNYTYVQELFLRQSLGKVKIILGLQDLNIEFANISEAQHYMNSSFGILPTVSANVPAPIFPLTSIGLSANWQISTRSSLMGAVFDGEPTDFANNPHNLSWDLTRKDGFLFFFEYQHVFSPDHLPALLKAGIYQHSHFSGNQDRYADSNSIHRNNYGLYLLGEKELWQNPDNGKALAVFIQAGLSPPDINPNKWYTGAGINFYGLLYRDGKDLAGLAIAHDHLRPYPGSETVFEFSYKMPVFNYFYLQPDVQYIINPSGTEEKLNNALAISLRFGAVWP